METNSWEKFLCVMRATAKRAGAAQCDLDDVAQEVVKRLLYKYQDTSIDKESRPTPVAFGRGQAICRNLVKDLKKKARLPITGCDIALVCWDSTRCVADFCVHTVLQDCDCSSMLPLHRQIIMLHNDGLKHVEISKQLGSPVGTIKSLLCRARKKARLSLRNFSKELVHG